MRIQRMLNYNWVVATQMNHEKNPGWLGYIGDDVPTQLYKEPNKPL